MTIKPAAALLLAQLLAPAVCAQIRYMVTPLGTLPDRQGFTQQPSLLPGLGGWLTGIPGGNAGSFAYAINNQGHVVGTSGGRAFIWTRSGGMTPIGDFPSQSYSFARSINDHGQVVGFSSSSPLGSPTQRAFLWSPNKGMQDLGTLDGGSFSLAFSINNQGHVVGRSDSPAGDRAFQWSAQDGMRDLGFGGNSSGYGINEGGQVVGFTQQWSGEHPHMALTWTSENGVRSLGAPVGISYSYALGLNDAGVVVGAAHLVGGGIGALVYSPESGWQQIATGAFAYAINNKGQVVGRWHQAFIWSQTTGLLNLNDWLLPGSSLDGPLDNALGINDAGLIIANSSNRAYLLTPVPEPSQWLAIATTGALAFATYRRLRACQ